jgi:hypothetical protein
MIAAVGLVENNPVNIVAAMLISPLMIRVSEISVAFYVRNNSSSVTELHVGEERNAGRILMGKSKGKKSLGKLQSMNE